MIEPRIENLNHEDGFELVLAHPDNQNEERYFFRASSNPESSMFFSRIGKLEDDPAFKLLPTNYFYPHKFLIELFLTEKRTLHSGLVHDGEQVFCYCSIVEFWAESENKGFKGEIVFLPQILSLNINPAELSKTIDSVYDSIFIGDLEISFGEVKGPQSEWGLTHTLEFSLNLNYTSSLQNSLNRTFEQIERGYFKAVDSISKFDYKALSFTYSEDENCS